MKIQLRILMFFLSVILLAASFPAFAELDGRVKTDNLRSLSSTPLGTLNSDAFHNLTALCESENQMYGAGPNTVSLIDSNGKVTRTLQSPIAEVAGVSGYTGSSLIIGDSGRNTIQQFDSKTGRTSQLLALGTLRWNANGFAGYADVLKVGKLASVAYDGANVYAAMSAGYSSTILKIDVKGNAVVGSTWLSTASSVPVASGFFKSRS